MSYDNNDSSILDLAQQLSLKFVVDCKNWTWSLLSSNVHNLNHLRYDAKIYGHRLDFSALSLENYFGLFKK